MEGRKYYIEVIHKDNTGGDHVAVAWEGPGISQQVIDGSYLMPYSDEYKWWPVFDDDPITTADTVEGYDYAQTLAGEATVAGSGGTLTFSKSVGPGWLEVAADGTLSGVPGDGNTGLNSFIIRATTDEGSSADATLEMTVLNAFTGELGLVDFAGFAGHWLDRILGGAMVLLGVKVITSNVN